jgi:hypothetical protein
VPTNAFVAVTYTVRVALLLLLVASTRNAFLEARYSAFVIETWSAVAGGVTLKTTDLTMLLRDAVIGQLQRSSSR